MTSRQSSRPHPGEAHPSPATTPGWDHPATPKWFRDATSLPARSHFVNAEGARIHYLAWNEHERHKPGVLFVHGFRGHARWWSFVAPYFCERFRVFSMDFSGHGESDARPSYDAATFARDIAAVIAATGIAPATVVGHSFGGARTLRLCADRPELVSRAVILDSYVHFTDDGDKRPRIHIGPRKTYATFEAAKARYRLTPPENAAADYVIDYIAHHSLAAHDGGFRWKFADDLPPGLNEHDGAELLQRIRVPITYMFGEYSVLGLGGRPAQIVAHIEGARGPIAIPEAHHHVMLDQPLATIAALRAELY
jgi:pimeloyl-ACP methyl ester carboxylesterase